MTMTPPHMDSPLRRSEVGAFRTPVQTPVINDDEAERREARRRTTAVLDTPSTTVEESETLKNCLQQCNDKLSRDNAWAVSVIDTLSSLMSRHHKALSNFKVAGSSLEASSRVYALRVDSVHSEVLRISSGLNKQKVINENDDEPSAQHENDGEQVGGAETNAEGERPAKRKKRTRKAVSTITKNKETINAHLDTNPFTDPIFAKMNSGVGNVSGSNRLLQNVLHSVDSELRLRMNHPFWDSKDHEPFDYPEQYDFSDMPDVDGEMVANLRLTGMVLRPQLCGYVISDTPAEQEESDDDRPSDSNMHVDEDIDHNSQMAVAFDINAAVEASQPDTHPFIDVDLGDFDELTVEEQVAINNCKGLRRAPVLIEDMRPVDSSSSTLEYSYRPMDKISQFWAGPSHWKFKKSRNKSLSLAQRFSANHTGDNRKQNLRGKRKPLKFRTQPLEFLEIHDNLFQKLDEKSKMRKANIQKKWDAKRMKLPTDLQINKDIFDIYSYSLGTQVMEEVEAALSPDIPDGSDYDNPNSEKFCDDIPNDDMMDVMDTEGDAPDMNTDTECVNQTVMEIATDFVGAPDKVTKIIVPFARRAKVVDMKQLKKCCTILIDQQMHETDKENLVQPPGFESEKYKGGVASFNKIYSNLPRLLTPSMNEALSTAVAFYSILHLANEANLRLVMDDKLKDFQIRKIED